jgi:hypothetical protein
MLQAPLALFDEADVALQGAETPQPLFTQADVISVYTRAQALEDGVLIDVSETAREAGFRWPVAVTNSVWAYVMPSKELEEAWGQSVEGRLWDTLWMASLAARAAKRAASDTDRVAFEVAYLLEPGKEPETVALEMVCGPGDDWEPVVTIMLQGED